MLLRNKNATRFLIVAMNEHKANNTNLRCARHTCHVINLGPNVVGAVNASERNGSASGGSEVLHGEEKAQRLGGADDTLWS
jgi:hypothetical protein